MEVLMRYFKSILRILKAEEIMGLIVAFDYRPNMGNA